MNKNRHRYSDEAWARVEERARIAARKAYPKLSPEYRRATQQRHNKKVRAAVLAAYGSVCACCGETEEKFLSLDHINGGGRKQRKELRKTGTAFYSWLCSQGFPDGLQVLCMNCNWAKGIYGACPHKKDHDN